MPKDFTPIETQEQFDAMVRERIERAERHAAERFADYDDLRQKAERLAEVEEQGKSDLRKANDELAALRKQVADRDAADKMQALRAKVSEATGVPVALIAGSDEESMTAFAEGVATFARRPAAPKVPGAGKSAGAGDGDAMADFVRKLIPTNE